MVLQDNFRFGPGPEFDGLERLDKLFGEAPAGALNLKRVR